MATKVSLSNSVNKRFIRTKFGDKISFNKKTSPFNHNNHTYCDTKVVQVFVILSSELRFQPET